MVAAIITHLHTNYGPITCAELETNCTNIATIWTPDNPIKTLWEWLCEIQHISITSGNPFTDHAIKDLIFLIFEANSIFTTACDTWHNHPVTQLTLIEFCKHFTSENKLTTSQAGFHSAHAAFIKTLATNKPMMPLVPMPSAVTDIYTTLASMWPIITNNGLNMYYCWTHGLRFNHNHTSGTCSNLANNHCTMATIRNMQGSNNTIMSNHHHPPTQE